MTLRREVLRAYVTKRLAHGERYVVTRAYLSDGTIEQRTNPGYPDEDLLPWARVGRYDDLRAERERLAREGWSIEREAARDRGGP
jgi:hypothetical protein